MGVSSSWSGSADVQYAISGPDLDKLAQYSQQLLAKLKTIPNVVDADTSLVFGKPELRLEIDRQRAADLGVRVADIATALNTLVAGQVVSTFHSGGEQYDVRLRAAQQFRTSAEGLTQLTVPSTKAGLGQPGSGGPHQAGNGAFEHQSPQPPAPGHHHRQRAAGRVAGRRHRPS